VATAAAAPGLADTGREERAAANRMLAAASRPTRENAGAAIVRRREWGETVRE
jgi:hypothetical protein